MRLPTIVAVVVVFVSAAAENLENAETELPAYFSNEEGPPASSNEKTAVENIDINVNLTCDSPHIIEGTIPPRLKNQQHTIGTEATYYCELGFVSRGSGGFRSICEFDQASKTAKWTDPEIACIPRSCGEPGFVANADRIGDLFTFPHKVGFRCHHGYKQMGQVVRFCQANGKWSGKLPECKAISCDRPTDPENGRVSYTSLKYGSELHYECDRGFMLRDHQPRSCTGDGNWSHNDPVCIEASCEEPIAPEHGTVQLLGDPKVDSLVAYACDAGRTLVGASLSKCLITGQWTFPPPKCASSCVIPSVSDGAVGRFEMKITSKYRREEHFVELQTGTVVIHGEIVDLLCNKDFFPVDDNPTLSEGQEFAKGVTCEDGKWTKTLQCKSATCFGDPPPIEHGVAVANKRHHGFVIYYKCETHYVKAASGRVICEFGTWAGFTPVCVDGRCYSSDLNVTGLARPSVEYIQHSRSIPISCAKGYKASNRWKSLSCHKGKWNIPQNVCVEESCLAEPPQISHGGYSPFNRVPGSEVHYQCDQGFEMNGQSTVQCRLGAWTGQPPSCLDPTVIPLSSKSTNESLQIETSTATSENATSTEHGTRNGTRKPEVAEEQSTSLSDDCFCTYLYPDRTLITKVRGIPLYFQDTVKKGETAFLSCRDPTKYQLWPNGLLSSADTKLACSVCEKWEVTDLPICTSLPSGSSWITWHDKLRLLPGGTIEVRPKENLTIPCHSLDVGYPIWTTPEFHNVIYTENDFGERRRFNSLLIMTEIQPRNAGNYQCTARDSYGLYYRPTILHLKVNVDGIRCPAVDDNVFDISYSDGYRMGSIVRYACREPSQEISGSATRTCSETGDWSGTEPTCITKQVTCPRIESDGIFIINYKDWSRQVNTIAQFSCRDTNKYIVGTKTRTCQPNGEWSKGNPTCIDITCPEFDIGDDLVVSYPNGNKPLSFARFKCLSPTILEGTPSSMCQYNGTWSNPQPSCVAPGCLIGDLMESIPENLVPDMEGVTGELSPVGSNLPLHCEANLVLVGSKNAFCGSNGKWDIGKTECIIGCYFNQEDLSTKLVIDPSKEHYRFGEFAVLSCPNGHRLTTDVERVMCIGSDWSNPIPDCQEITAEDED